MASRREGCSSSVNIFLTSPMNMVIWYGVWVELYFDWIWELIRWMKGLRLLGTLILKLKAWIVSNMKSIARAVARRRACMGCDEKDVMGRWRLMSLCLKRM